MQTSPIEKDSDDDDDNFNQNNNTPFEIALVRFAMTTIADIPNEDLELILLKTRLRCFIYIDLLDPTIFESALNHCYSLVSIDLDAIVIFSNWNPDLLEQVYYTHFLSLSETPKSVPPPPKSEFSNLILGGTFDRLHFGHKILLSCALLSLDTSNPKSTLWNGICDHESLFKRKKYKEIILPWEERNWFISDFCHLVAPTMVLKFFRLYEPFGPTISEPQVEGIVLSTEVGGSFELINEKRKSINIPPLKLVSVHLHFPSATKKYLPISDNYSDAEKISSTHSRIVVSKNIEHIEKNSPLEFVFSGNLRKLMKMPIESGYPQIPSNNQNKATSNKKTNIHCSLLSDIPQKVSSTSNQIFAIFLDTIEKTHLENILNISQFHKVFLFPVNPSESDIQNLKSKKALYSFVSPHNQPQESASKPSLALFNTYLCDGLVSSRTLLVVKNLEDKSPIQDSAILQDHKPFSFPTFFNSVCSTQILHGLTKYSPCDRFRQLFYQNVLMRLIFLTNLCDEDRS